jgi:hypothetical protein
MTTADTPEDSTANGASNAAQAWRPAAWVHDRVRHNYGPAHEIPPAGAFVIVGAACARLATFPPRTPQQRGRLRFERARLAALASNPDAEPAARAHARSIIAERRAWPPSAETLDALFPGFPRERLNLSPELRTRRFPRPSRQGPAPKQWPLALPAFAPWLASVLIQHGLPVSLRKTSPFTKTCRDLLALIYWQEKPPSCSTVSAVLRKFLVVKPNKGDER